MSLWVIRILFLALSTTGGCAISQVRPELIAHIWLGAIIGFGFGGLLIAIDEMIKGFSLRAFSAITFGLLLGMVVAQLIDRSGLFEHTDEETRWMVRICLFVGFSYIGMILAMRSNKEDFSLIIPYVRFAPQSKPETPQLLDTSVIIDGRIAELIDGNFIEGLIVVPRFVLFELQQLADSMDAVKRARGRHGLDVLNRIRQNTKNELKVYDGDFPDETGVDAKLVRLARNINARLFTTDHNLARIAEIQKVICIDMTELSKHLRQVLLPGERISLRIVRDGKDKGQGVGFTQDGTMVVVNGAHSSIGRQVEAEIQSSVQTGAGVIIFAALISSFDTTTLKKE